MELGNGPLSSSGSSKVFDTEDPKEAGAAAVAFGLVGGVLGGVSVTAGTAAVVVSMPGILAGVATGITVYGAGLTVKWTCKKLRNLLKS